MIRAALATGALLALAAPSGATVALPNPLLGSARLVGTFELAGRITTAVRVPGEHTGQTITRRWSFLPTCQVGSCRTVGLLRRRANGSDPVILTRKRPGYYTGNGTFYAPLRCSQRVVARGLRVPYTVTVTVTAAVRDATGAVVATRVDARYTNRLRHNLTKCVAFPGHDAATYHGHVLLGSSSGGSGGSGVAGGAP